MKISNALLVSLLSLSVVACGGSSSDDNSTTQDTSGDTSSEDTTNNDTSSDDGSDTGSDGDTDNDTDTGTGGGGTSGGDTIRNIGVVYVDEYVAENSVEAYGSFIYYAPGITYSDFTGLTSPALDTCTVSDTVFDFSDFDFGLPDYIDLEDIQSVSAGEVLTLTSSAGTYLSLIREEYEGQFEYNPEPEDVSGSMPAQLTLDIPGDVFPQFANVTMPRVDSFVLTSPTDVFSATSPDTTFMWVAGSDPDAFVSISTSAFNIDFSGDSPVFSNTSVDCEVQDDGSFSFPSATKSEMGADFIGDGYEAFRVATKFVKQGDAILTLVATSEYD